MELLDKKHKSEWANLEMKKNLATGELKKKKAVEMNKLLLKNKNDIQDLDEFHQSQQIDFNRVVKIYNTS